VNTIVSNDGIADVPIGMDIRCGIRVRQGSLPEE
jgi:hypothetical protein